MRDFTWGTYETLINALRNSGAYFYSFADSCTVSMKKPSVILRHDVDRKPQNALRIAEMEHRFGICSTYYFRISNKIFKPDIIKKIASLGHEIGYHFEDLSSSNGDIDLALESFRRNLKKLRSCVPVKTIAMHGSPLSKYNNNDLIRELNFPDLDLIGEPYSKIEKEKWIYITDTGRTWENSLLKGRDKATFFSGFSVSSTFQLIDAIRKEFPGKPLMINVHPERWSDQILVWGWNLVWQSFKNVVKIILIKTKHVG